MFNAYYFSLCIMNLCIIILTIIISYYQLVIYHIFCIFHIIMHFMTFSENTKV